jgi:hypothetical protein
MVVSYKTFKRPYMQSEIERKIEQMIYVIRGYKVMFDQDLAQLYGVKTKVLNQSVKRNKERFPDDFMFQLSDSEYQNLKSQFVTSSFEHGGRRKLPFVFAANGVAMLSSVLNSKQSIKINITIMRIFTKLQSFLTSEKHLCEKVDKLEQNTTSLFKIVFERLDYVESNIKNEVKIKRNRIGFKSH